jgi:UDP-GlcNAc:undecaprenyl-phosphate GlcNAc-1-phosphate transferase
MGRKLFPFVALAFFLALAAYWVIPMDASKSFPYLHVEGPENIHFKFLYQEVEQEAACRKTLEAMKAAILSSCPQCKVAEQACPSQLTGDQRQWLSNSPLDVPSLRLPNGVLIFESPGTGGLDACKSSESQAKRVLDVRCIPPHEPRPLPETLRVPWLDTATFLAGLMLLTGIIAWFAGYLIVEYEHLHAHLSHDPVDAGPQKFHATPTPRIGGIGIFLSLIVVAAIIPALKHKFAIQDFAYLTLAAIPVFAIGLLEDITKRIGVRTRLIVIIIGAALATWLLDAHVTRLDVPGVDAALAWLPVSIVFTVFAVCGLTNAINIIDGANGLASGCSFIMLCALGAIGVIVNDTLVAAAAFSVAGAAIGFLLWNWPRGQIFLGDGGAYLLGFWIAELSVLLVSRNPSVSAWAPMLIISYPVVETMFTIWRRKVLRGSSPGKPDALHLHQLLQRRVLNSRFGQPPTQSWKSGNSRVAPMPWALLAIMAVIATANFRSPGLLVGATGLFVMLYVWLYRSIVLWRSARIFRMTSAIRGFQRKEKPNAFD